MATFHRSALRIVAGFGAASCTAVWLLKQTSFNAQNDAEKQPEPVDSTERGDYSSMPQEQQQIAPWTRVQPVDEDAHGRKYLTAVRTSRDICQRIKDEVGAPGLTVGVSVDGKTIWEEGFGYSDVENRVPCHPGTVMRIASISKPITMAAVARLWEQKKLSLDIEVQEYVPYFPKKKFEGKEVKITTRMLLCHLSGIRTYKKKGNKVDKDVEENEKKIKGEESKNEKQVKEESNMKLKSKVRAAAETDAGSRNTCSAVAGREKRQDSGSPEEYAPFSMPEYYLKEKYESVEKATEIFRDDDLISYPGTKYLYTTLGWTLVSAVVEGVTKIPFPTYMKHLFDQLGLHHTYLDENDTLIYNRARYYIKNKKDRLINAPYVDNSYKWAGGGFVSTAGDLLKFGCAMLYSFQQNEDEKAKELQNSPGMEKSPPKEQKNKVLVKPDEDQRQDIQSGPGVGNSENKSSLRLPGFLKPETVTALWTVVENTQVEDGGYGLGWVVVPKKGDYGFCKDQKYYVCHTGGAIGASSVLLILPSGTHQKGDEPPKGVVVAILTNLQQVGLKKTAFKIASVFEEIEHDKNI